MHNQKGMSLIELVLVLALASAALLATATYALPWIARERARSAVYDVQSYLQLARIEAISRNRDCRFVLDTSTRTLEVYDANGTPATTGDDILLYQTTLPEQITFARPDGGAAVTLSQIGTSDAYETVFTSDGIVADGTGEVALFGGDEFNRVLVFGAGGVTVDHWTGSGWASASGSAYLDPGGGGGTVVDDGASATGTGTDTGNDYGSGGTGDEYQTF